MSYDAPLVDLTIKGGTARVTRTREAKMNAFDTELVESIHDALDRIEAEDVRLIVFDAKGIGGSGGLDLGGLETQSDGDLLLRVIRIEQVLQRIYHARAATLAFVHGACFGAAADLVLACETRVAAPEAKFRMPGAQFGLVLGTKRLSNTIGAQNARRLLMRETPFDATTARDSGFVTVVEQIKNWQKLVSDHETLVAQLPGAVYHRLSARLVPDTRADDMAALVASGGGWVDKSTVTGLSR